MEPKTDDQVWPGLYHVVMGARVTGLVGGLLWSKLKVPVAVSCRILPVPWPSSSWMPTWTSKARSRFAR